MAEQRYLAVLAVIAQGHEVTAVAQHWGVPGRRCMSGWAGMRPAAWRGWSIGRTGPRRARIR